MTYIDHKRKSKKQPLQSHTGTSQSFVERVHNAAVEYGANRKTPAAKEYAEKLYDLAFDARMLHQAYKDQKGYAAGIDGVPVKELGRYVAYVEWANACKLPFRKRPSYADTIFPTADARAIALLGLAYDPEHNYRLKGISFVGGRAALGTLREMGPRCTPKQANELVKEFQGEDLLTYTVYGDLSQKVSLDLSDPDALFKAGMTETGLVNVLAAAQVALGNAVENATYGRTKDKVVSYTPLKWLANDDAEDHLAWSACRWLHGILSSGGYRPQPLRALEISKSDGGIRTLNIPTVIDRIVERAAFMTIEPMLEKVFRPSSVGCRNDLDRFDALAAISNHYPDAPGRFILCADIRKAFDNVPHEQLLACLEKYIPNKRMRQYFEKVIKRPGSGRSDVGIHQGGPLSPMFLNIILHERLDVPFLKMLPSNLVYVRYVDDLAVFGFKSREEGVALLEQLQRILKPIGLELHTQPPKTQIIDLSSDSVEVAWNTHPTGSLDDGVGVDRYLGLGLHGNADGRLEFFLPASWPERIADMYRRAEVKIEAGGYAGSEGAHTHIRHATESWLRAFAPAWREKWQEEIVARVIEIANAESPHAGELKVDGLAKSWKESYNWWLKRCGEVQADTMMGWRAVVHA